MSKSPTITVPGWMVSVAPLVTLMKRPAVDRVAWKVRLLVMSGGGAGCHPGVTGPFGTLNLVRTGTGHGIPRHPHRGGRQCKDLDTSRGIQGGIGWIDDVIAAAGSEAKAGEQGSGKERASHDGQHLEREGFRQADRLRHAG
jgi:hypothetical protein